MPFLTIYFTNHYCQYGHEAVCLATLAQEKKEIAAFSLSLWPPPISDCPVVSKNPRLFILGGGRGGGGGGGGFLGTAFRIKRGGRGEGKATKTLEGKWEKLFLFPFFSASSQTQTLPHLLSLSLYYLLNS